MNAETNSLEYFVSLLPIDKHGLDEELRLQAEVQYRIADRMSLAGEHYAKATEKMKRAEGLAFMAFKLSGDADKLATEKARVDAGRAGAWQDEADARSEFEAWSNLYEAWKARGYSLKELSSLFAAQYFVVGPNSNPRTEYPAVAAAKSRRRTGGPM